MADLLDSVISNSPVAPTGGESGRGTHAEQKLEAGEHSRASQVKMTGFVERSPDATLSQGLSLGANSTATGVEFNASIYVVSDTVYYFELVPSKLRETAVGEELIYERLAPATPLRVGQKYQIRVSLSKNEYRRSPQSEISAYRLEQVPLKLPKEVFIQLAINSSDQNVLDAVGSISPAQGRLSPDNLGQHQDFEFTIEKDYKVDIPLELSYLGGPNGMLPYHAAMLTLKLEGNEPLPPPSDVLHLATQTLPPPHTARLYVSEGSEGSLVLRGWLGQRSEGGLSLEVSTFEWADPEDCPDEEAYLKKLSDSFYDYSIDRASAVALWFEKALDHFGKQCSFLIVDEASALIPWEMFKLTDGRYLGAHALIVRWVEPQSRTGGAWIPAEPKFEGRVSAYVHPLDVKRALASPEMQQLLPQHNENPEELEDDLLAGGSQVGLVYLCYGGILKYGDEEESLSRLNRYEPYKQDVHIRYNFVDGKLDPRPIVFANAPYSGRVLKCGQKSCGLARATLKSVAASYIGTLGPVERSYAAKFALKLLTAAASHEGCKPAELLREMRADVIARVMDQKLTQTERMQARKEFPYPFMYVHYGHPQDWVKISSPAEAEEAEGSDEHV